MRNYNNYALGNWTKGEGKGAPLFNAITGEELGRASSKGLDFSDMMSYARKVGGPKLRKMTYATFIVFILIEKPSFFSQLRCYYPQ